MVPIWPNSICSLFLLVEREGIVTEVDGAGATAAGTWADSCAGGVSSANEANTGVEFVIIIITVNSKCKFINRIRSPLCNYSAARVQVPPHPSLSGPTKLFLSVAKKIFKGILEIFPSYRFSFPRDFPPFRIPLPLFR